MHADALRAERCHAFKVERSDRGAQGREAPRYGRADALRLSAPAKGRCPEWIRAAQRRQWLWRGIVLLPMSRNLSAPSSTMPSLNWRTRSRKIACHGDSLSGTL